MNDHPAGSQAGFGAEAPRESVPDSPDQLLALQQGEAVHTTAGALPVTARALAVYGYCNGVGIEMTDGLVISHRLIHDLIETLTISLQEKRDAGASEPADIQELLTLSNWITSLDSVRRLLRPLVDIQMSG
jgi:hypothetical protein